MSYKEKEHEIQNSVCSLCVSGDGGDADAALKPKKKILDLTWTLPASITVESSLVFPIVLMIIILIIEISFRVHDATAGNLLAVYQHNKLNECIWNCYDVNLKTVDTNALATRPLIGYDENFSKEQDDKLRSLISEYFRGISIGGDAAVKFIEPDYSLKNSMMVRWSQILIDRGGLFTND